jgi:hypothetical protein
MIDKLMKRKPGQRGPNRPKDKPQKDYATSPQTRARALENYYRRKSGIWQLVGFTHEHLTPLLALKAANDRLEQELRRLKKTEKKTD